MLMAVPHSDAKDSLGDAGANIGDLVYADDTLIMATNADDADKVHEGDRGGRRELQFCIQSGQARVLSGWV